MDLLCGPQPGVESSPDTHPAARDPREWGDTCQHLGVRWSLTLTPRDRAAHTHSTPETHIHTLHMHPQPHLETGLHTLETCMRRADSLEKTLMLGGIGGRRRRGRQRMRWLDGITNSMDAPQ